VDELVTLLLTDNGVAPMISPRTNADYDISPTAWEALELYVEHRIETGSFLRSCLENDFVGAMSRMHPASFRDLQGIAAYITWEVPPEARGSHSAVQQWIDSRKRARVQR
jgi:hypothetical protein